MTEIKILQLIIVIFRLKRRLVGILQGQAVPTFLPDYSQPWHNDKKSFENSSASCYKYDINKLVEENKNGIQNHDARSGNYDDNNHRKYIGG